MLAFGRLNDDGKKYPCKKNKLLKTRGREIVCAISRVYMQ